MDIFEPPEVVAMPWTSAAAAAAAALPEDPDEPEWWWPECEPWWPSLFIKDERTKPPEICN